MNTPTSDATPAYPTQPLKTLADPVKDYSLGDVYLSRNAQGVLTVRQLLTPESISELGARRDAIGESRPNFMVIRSNGTLDPALLMGWLSTNRGQQRIRSSLEKGIFTSQKIVWQDIAGIPVSVPPKEDQAALSRLFAKSVGWMDEYVENLERKAQIIKQMRHGIADRLISRPTDKKELHGWLSALANDTPPSNPSAMSSQEEVISAEIPARRRPQGP
jgi:hypothetical protein